MSKPSLAELSRNVTLTINGPAKAQQLPEWLEDCTGHNVTLGYAGRSYTLDFWMGGGTLQGPPTSEDVLGILLADAAFLAALDRSPQFAPFIFGAGGDLGPKRGENAELRRLLGDDYEAFLLADR